MILHASIIKARWGGLRLRCVYLKWKSGVDASLLVFITCYDAILFLSELSSREIDPSANKHHCCVALKNPFMNRHKMKQKYCGKADGLLQAFWKYAVLLIRDIKMSKSIQSRKWYISLNISLMRNFLKTYFQKTWVAWRQNLYSTLKSKMIFADLTMKWYVYYIGDTCHSDGQFAS